MRHCACFLLLFLILTQCTSISSSLQKSNSNKIKEFLLSLDLEEEFLLEFFFRSLIQEDSIGYVLIGGKPMGFYSYLKPKAVVNSHHFGPVENIELFFRAFDEDHALFQKGWEIWKKYAYRFCGNNLIFDFFDQNLEVHYVKVAVFNKRLFLSILDQNKKQFSKIEPSLMDKNLLFDALMNNEKTKRKFYSRHDLLGICLGYGQKNADLFQQMSLTLTSSGKLGYTLEIPSLDHLRDLEQKWNTLKHSFNSGLKDRTSRKFLFTVGLGFRVDQSIPETSMLQHKYTELRKKLTQEYSNGDFLQKTLELIVLADQG